jgi:selenocysteine-specific elongation factor
MSNLPRLIIGTAGHVDHGKTELIRALTGINADRWREEQERGMTIDLGFAYLDLPGGGRAAIVDVPGHERFIHNMLAGATGIDLVLLVVAADEGVMPQTREHVAILDLLGVSEGIVVLTKADRADADMIEIVREDVRDLLATTGLADAPQVVTSARTGEGMDDLVRAVDEAAGRRPRHGRDRVAPARTAEGGAAGGDHPGGPRDARAAAGGPRRLRR